MPRMLLKGTRGADVSQAQGLLNSKSPTTLPRLRVDGEFGTRTEARVIEFQRCSRLLADGIIGARTWAALSPVGQSGLSFAEFDGACSQAVELLRRELKAKPEVISFFNRHRHALQMIAYPERAPIGTMALVSPRPAIGAVGVLVWVGIAAAVLTLFALACVIVMAQNRGANPADVKALEQEFDERMVDLMRKISQASIDVALLAAAVKVTVEKAVKDQVEWLKRQIERCMAMRPNAPLECLRRLPEIEAQMTHCIQQAIILTFLTVSGQPHALGKQLIGLAKSFGFLMLLVSKFGKCMKCDFLVFFDV
ncbi:MAG TPA: peptidoglycan-binding domain-containing protein [Vineibacter sp.]|nr:peptidoglycan-binding domain-containing protein [Vineibacter sp.]